MALVLGLQSLSRGARGALGVLGLGKKESAANSGVTLPASPQFPIVHLGP